ncbi:MAG: helix-turn-helix domain-containing protein [Salinirussus sp.]
MPHAKLTLSIPEAVWIGKVSRDHPEAVIRVLAATATDDHGVARLELRGPDADSLSEAIRNQESVTEITVFEATDSVRCLQIETDVPLLLQAFQESGVPLDLPVEITAGSLSVEVPLPQDSLSTLGTTLDAFGVDYTVEWIRQDMTVDPLLTDRQEWIFEEAISRGYYDTPRTTTLVELADDLNIAKSTCSEMLHRVEERVMKAYHDGGQPDRESPIAPAD